MHGEVYEEGAGKGLEAYIDLKKQKELLVHPKGRAGCPLHLGLVQVTLRAKFDDIC